jgi:8-oxo-dGTP pyrophosphatase MutT (NUDIX family)
MATGDTSWRRERAEGEEIPEAVPAATTVLVRDGASGLEVLMARRNSRLAFAGGSWVFPGGRVDPEDWEGEPVTDLRDARMLDAARRAAVREAAEETGAIVDAAALVLISHWTPPIQAPKRFATYFFLGPAPVEIADLQADGGEIHELGWLHPAAAIEARNAGEIELAPPQFITLEHLRPFATAAGALAHYATHRPEHFATSFAGVEGGMIAMYEGDAAYGTDEPDAPGPRHRLWMLDSGWRYERTVVTDG